MRSVRGFWVAISLVSVALAIAPRRAGALLNYFDPTGSSDRAAEVVQPFPFEPPEPNVAAKINWQDSAALKEMKANGTIVFSGGSLVASSPSDHLNPTGIRSY